MPQKRGYRPVAGHSYGDPGKSHAAKLNRVGALDEIPRIPDMEVGKMPVREPLRTEAIEQKTCFKTDWLM